MTIHNSRISLEIWKLGKEIFFNVKFEPELQVLYEHRMFFVDYIMFQAVQHVLLLYEDDLKDEIFSEVLYLLHLELCIKYFISIISLYGYF